MSLTETGSSTKTRSRYQQPYFLMSGQSRTQLWIRPSAEEPHSHMGGTEEELCCRTEQVQMLVVEFELSFLQQTAINYYKCL